MVSRYGSDATFAGNADGGLVDNRGNAIISSSVGPGDAPLGYAVLNQIGGKFANGLINFPPPDTASAIGNFDNPLPFWNVTDESNGRINATFVVLDSSISSALSSAIGSAGVGGQAIGSYVGLGALKISTLNAVSGDTYTLSQRAPTIVVPRMKEIGWAVYGYSGTATPTAAFTVKTDVIYYDGEGSAISTATLGSSTNTQIALYSGTVHYGYTQGTSATDYLSDAAMSVEMTSTFTVTAGTVTQDQAIYVSSSIINPQYAKVGGSVVVDVFTSSGTWTRPTGVDYVTVIGVGGGGGGASGAGIGGVVGVGERRLDGTGGGGGGRVAVVANLPVTDASYSIGIGAGGAGGVGGTATKASGGTAAMSLALVSGSDGGVSTFGSLLTFGAGIGATARTGGAAGSVVSLPVFTFDLSASGGGGAGGLASSSTTATLGTAGVTNTYLSFYKTAGTVGANGTQGSTTGTVGTATLGGAGTATAAGWGGGGGGSGFIPRTSVEAMDNSAGGRSGGGGAGGPARRHATTSGTMTATGGAGGSAVANSGGGGGAGGDASVLSETQAVYNTSTLTVTGGNGGAGASGIILIAYTA
jgi:hypothetical protein